MYTKAGFAVVKTELGCQIPYWQISQGKSSPDMCDMVVSTRSIHTSKALQSK